MRLIRRFVVAMGMTPLVLSLLAPIARVSADQPSLVSWISQDGAFVTSAVAQPGHLVNIEVSYTNQNSFAQKSVTLTDTLPTGAQYKRGSAYLFTLGGPATGTKQADTITTSGIETGHLAAGQPAAVEFQIYLPKAATLACGDTQLQNKAAGVSQNGNQHFNAVSPLTITRDCPTTTPPTPTTPAVSCDLSQFSVASVARTRQVRVSSFHYTHDSAASYNHVSIDWGDGSALNQAPQPVGVLHTYTRDGSYIITAAVHFNVITNGTAVDQTATCQLTKQIVGPVATTTTTTTTNTSNTGSTGQVESASTSADDDNNAAADDDIATDDTADSKSLVNTGPGNMIGLFVLVSVVGTLVGRLIIRRRAVLRR